MSFRDNNYRRIDDMERLAYLWRMERENVQNVFISAIFSRFNSRLYAHFCLLL